MSEFLFILGVFIAAWGLVEALWTSMWVDGNSAPLTGRLTTGIWRFLKWISPKSKDRFLSLAGPLILFCTIFTWVFMIWLGWSLMFFSDPNSIFIRNQEFDPQFIDVGWYVAYLMFTVGNGDFLPHGGLWQGLSILIAFSGMSIVTLSITYLFQIVQAVNNKRAFASEVCSIGKTAEEWVKRQWTGQDFGAMALQLNSLSGQLTRLSEQHLAYPILHYYHAAQSQKSQDRAVVILDDALTLISKGIQKDFQPPQTILISARESVTTFLSTLKKAFIQASPDNPPSLQLTELQRAKLPVIDQREFQEKIQEMDSRRKLMLGLIQKGSWEWPG